MNITHNDLDNFYDPKFEVKPPQVSIKSTIVSTFEKAGIGGLVGGTVGGFEGPIGMVVGSVIGGAVMFGGQIIYDQINQAISAIETGGERVNQAEEFSKTHLK